MSECTEEHRPPEGPNEDIGLCATPNCWFPVGVLRPEGEQFGLHADDCSLPRRHRGRCVGGGDGHAPVALVRGWWGPTTEADIAAARAEHAPATHAATRDESAEARGGETP